MNAVKSTCYAASAMAGMTAGALLIVYAVDGDIEMLRVAGIMLITASSVALFAYLVCDAVEEERYRAEARRDPLITACVRCGDLRAPGSSICPACAAEHGEDEFDVGRRERAMSRDDRVLRAVAT